MELKISYYAYNKAHVYVSKYRNNLYFFHLKKNDGKTLCRDGIQPKIKDKS